MRVGQVMVTCRPETSTLQDLARLRWGRHFREGEGAT